MFSEQIYQQLESMFTLSLCFLTILASVQEIYTEQFPWTDSDYVVVEREISQRYQPVFFHMFHFENNDAKRLPSVQTYEGVINLFGKDYNATKMTALFNGYLFHEYGTSAPGMIGYNRRNLNALRIKVLETGFIATCIAVPRCTLSIGGGFKLTVLQPRLVQFQYWLLKYSSRNFFTSRHPFYPYGDIRNRLYSCYPPASKIKKEDNPAYVGIFATFLTSLQQHRISHGFTETVQLPINPSKVLRLTLLSALAPAENITYIFQGRHLTTREEKRTHIEKAGYFDRKSCSKIHSMMYYTIIFRQVAERSGTYGIISRFDPNLVTTLAGDLEMKATLELVIGNPGQHVAEDTVSQNQTEIQFSFQGDKLVIPSGNTSTYFDITIIAPLAELSSWELSVEKVSDESSQNTNFVLSALSTSHYRVAFYKLRESDNGNYSISISNGSNTHSKTIQIVKAEKLKMAVTPLKRAVELGVTGDLVCVVTGHPRPVVTWESGLEPIKQNKRIKVTTTFGEDGKSVICRMEIREPEYMDSSYYYCKAWNEVQREKVTAIFDVYPIGSHLADEGFEHAQSSVITESGNTTEEENGHFEEDSIEEFNFDNSDPIYEFVAMDRDSPLGRSGMRVFLFVVLGILCSIIVMLTVGIATVLVCYVIQWYKGLKYSYKKSKPGYFKRFFRRSGKSKVDKLDQRIPLLATSDSDDY